MVHLIDNKKAQEGSPWGNMLGLIIGAIVVVLIVLYVSGFFDRLGGATDTLPGPLAAKAEICKSVASNQVAFCEFTELSLSGIKGDSFVNCAYGQEGHGTNSAFKEELKEAGVTLPTCTSSEKDYCDRITDSTIKAKTFVNGLNCATDVK